MYRTIYFLIKGQETGFFNSFNIQDGGKDDSVVLKYEPVQYSTLKNEPQVHFSTGSFLNVTPAIGVIRTGYITDLYITWYI